MHGDPRPSASAQSTAGSAVPGGRHPASAPAGGDATGFVRPTHFTAEQEGESSQAFVEAYRDTYGEDPSNYAAEAYDAVRFIARGLAQADSVDRGALQEGLAAVAEEGFSGAQGDITFDGNDAHVPGVLVQWDGSREVPLSMPVLLLIDPGGRAVLSLLVQVLAFEPIQRRGEDHRQDELQILVGGIGIPIIPLAIARHVTSSVQIVTLVAAFGPAAAIVWWLEAAPSGPGAARSQAPERGQEVADEVVSSGAAAQARSNASVLIAFLGEAALVE